MNQIPVGHLAVQRDACAVYNIIMYSCRTWPQNDPAHICPRRKINLLRTGVIIIIGNSQHRTGTEPHLYTEWAQSVGERDTYRTTPPPPAATATATTVIGHCDIIIIIYPSTSEEIACQPPGVVGHARNV